MTRNLPPRLCHINNTAKKTVVFFVFFFLFLSGPAAHAGTTFQGTVSFENTNFLAKRSQFSINDYETLDANFKFLYDNEKFFQTLLNPRIKVDFLDESRNRYLPHEATFTFYNRHGWQSSTGLRHIHWGVAHAFNPTDVINRRDFEDNFFNPEKLGELMVTIEKTWALEGKLKELQIQAYTMPLFQKTPLPELDTRYPIRGNAGLIPYTVTDNQSIPGTARKISGALLVSMSGTSLDVSTHYYHGLSHSPGYELVIDSTGALRLQPFYYLIDMVGLNAAYTAHDFVFTFESALTLTSNNFSHTHEVPFEDGNALPKTYWQFVPGLSYVVDGVIGRGRLTLMGEYLGELNQAQNLRNFRPFQNDVFVGLSYDWLNIKNTRFELGVIKDLGNRETAIAGEMSSKLYKELKLNVGGMILTTKNGLNTPLSFFQNNSHVWTKLSYSWGGDF